MYCPEELKEKARIEALKREEQNFDILANKVMRRTAKYPHLTINDCIGLMLCNVLKDISESLGDIENKINC